MGPFKTSRTGLDEVQAHCDAVVEAARKVRTSAERSLRGKYEYMRPEERADLLRQAHQLSRRLHQDLDAARAEQKRLDDSDASSEEVLAAETLVLACSLDTQKADGALGEARASLLAGMSEVEEFYGPKSREARHLRKVLAEFQTAP